MAVLLVIPTILLPFVFVVGALYLARGRSGLKENPLTKELRRPAGHSLKIQLERHYIDLLGDVMSAFLFFYVPFVVYTVYDVFDVPLSKHFLGGSIVVCGGLLVKYSYSIYKRFRLIPPLRLGYECEVAVGQELDLLMLQGYRIYHDIEAEGFNIDHLAIGPNGVFAIETKGRRRPLKNVDSRQRYRVTCYKDRLQFPTWSECDVFNQADRQSKWVSSWLSSATGMEVKSLPVIVLPGWFLDRKEKTLVHCLAGKEICSTLPKINSQRLTPEEIERISHQVFQRSKTDDFGKLREEKLNKET